MRHVPAIVIAALIAFGGAGTAFAGPVAPPGPSGCDPPPTASDQAPRAQLPGRGTFRASSGRVGLVLRDVTQATRATITARLLDGRRVGGIDHGRYTCTRPARREYVAFGADRRLVARELGRDGGRVRRRVTLPMTNANGRPATGARVVVLPPHPEPPH